MILDLKEVITQKKITSKIPKISLGCKKEIALQISETKINDLILLLLPLMVEYHSFKLMLHLAQKLSACLRSILAVVSTAGATHNGNP